MAFPQVVSVPEISSILRVLGMNHLSSIYILRLLFTVHVILKDKSIVSKDQVSKVHFKNTAVSRCGSICLFVYALVFGYISWPTTLTSSIPRDGYSKMR